MSIKVLPKRSLVFTVLGIVALVIQVGCGSGEMRSVTDNVDAEAIAEYERMIAEAEERANSENAK